MATQTNTPFSIDAKTSTLSSLLNGNKTKYVIPIYQRPYSWEEKEVRKFLSNILESYWGSDKNNPTPEPFFIGTMQLSPREENLQEIIDGQQRLSTFLVLLKMLKEKYPNCSKLNEINFHWLSTEVNNQAQHLKLQTFINSKIDEITDSPNRYKENASIILTILNENEIFEDNINEFDESGDGIDFDIEKFTTFLLTNIYFVVIETKALLSKTLQIFNAINTTGLDLNGADVFKIRMYEYLTVVKMQENTIFEQISGLYKKIDDYESKEKLDIHMSDILWTYQHFIIEKYNLPTSLHSLGTNTFFEKCFDALVNNVKNEFYSKTFDISIDEIDKLIDARYEWEKNWYRNAEDMGCYKLIEISRYGRFKDLLPTILIFQFQNSDTFYLTRQLSKLYTIYSVRYAKSIYSMQEFSYSLIKDMLNSSFDDVMHKINMKIKEAENWPELTGLIAENLTENKIRKTIICRLSALLHEIHNDNKEITNEEEISALRSKLFGGGIDIEHIRANAFFDEYETEDVKSQWNNYLNSIGNLIVFNSSNNRSNQAVSYKQKRESYLNSEFNIVKSFAETHNDWNLENVQKRQNEEVEKLRRFLFN